MGNDKITCPSCFYLNKEWKKKFLPTRDGDQKVFKCNSCGIVFNVSLTLKPIFISKISKSHYGAILIQSKEL